MRFVLMVLLVCCFYSTHAQEDLSSEVWVKVIVFDKTDGRPIENAQIISYQTMQIFSTDTLGSFRNVFNASDSLKIFGLGYEPIVVKVKRFKELDEGLELELTRRTYMIRSVDVPASTELHLHLPSDIKLVDKDEKSTPVALRSDSYSSKPPVLAAVVNPLSFVHYYTSKKEKRKRNAIKELAKAADQEKINEFFNRDVIKEVSGYEEGDKLNSFIVHCNINLDVASRDNHLIVKQKISDLKKTFELVWRNKKK